MKTLKTCLAVGCLFLAAAGAMAQNYYLATQQAKRASAENNAEQQRIQNASGGASGPAAPGSALPNAAATDPKLQATLKNISGLQLDFAAVIAATDATDPALKTALLNDLTQAAQGTKATGESVKKLAADLVPALAGQKKLTPAVQTRLARDVHALFNSAHLTDAQRQTILTDVQNALTDAGVSLDNAVDVATDLKAIAAETK